MYEFCVYVLQSKCCIPVFATPTFQCNILFGFQFSVGIDDYLADSHLSEDGDSSDDDFVPSIHLEYVLPFLFLIFVQK